MFKTKRVRAKNQMKFSAKHIFAAILGTAFIAGDTWMNLEYMYEAEKAITSMVVITPLMSFTAAASAYFIGDAFRQRKYFEGFGLVLLAVFLFSFSFTASLDRVSSSRAKLITAKKNHNIAYNLAKSSYDKAVSDRKMVKKLKINECKTGRGKMCRSWEKGLKMADQEILQKADILKQAGAPIIVLDPLGKRIATMLNDALGLNVTIEQVQTYHPLIIPIILQLGGFIFIGIAFSKDKPAQKPEKRQVELVEEVRWIEAMKEAAKNPAKEKIFFDEDGLLKAPYTALTGVFDVKSVASVKSRMDILADAGKLEKVGAGRSIKYRMLENA